MLSGKVRTNVYLDSSMKDKAKQVFKQYGVSLSDAINIFLTQVVIEKGIPFEVKIPNDETIEAINEARKGINSDFTTLDDLEKEAKKCLK